MPDLKPKDVLPATSSRRWSFGDCEFAEISRQLTVGGRPLKLESKPLDVLQLLLEHPAEVLTKEELIGAVWSTATTDQSLATAISKLRKAFGGSRDAVILNVSGVGYRMAVPVLCTVEVHAAPPVLHLQPGDPIPNRADWVAVQALTPGPAASVWLATRRSSPASNGTDTRAAHEIHVFKFATDGVRLRALQREVALSRLFAKTLPDRARFVPILDWNFDQQPFFIESEYAGANLLEFAVTDTFRRLATEERIALAAEVAQAVAEAHGVGTLHNDLKPANILLMARPSAHQTGDAQNGNGAGSTSFVRHWQVRVADFGVASLHDPNRLRDLQITHHGEFDGQVSGNGSSHPVGTAMYRAPELLLPNATPSMRGDVYALGVLLYQLVCGDFLEPPSPGWEARIADPLLREDIAAAANIDPAQRLATAAELAERLLTLPARRAERERWNHEQQTRQRAEQALARARERRPWVIFAITALALGVLASLWFYRRATEQRNAALARGATLAALNDFLTVDLLNQSNPLAAAAHAGQTSQETLSEAIERAVPQIDRRFAHDPAVAGQIYETLAAALDARTRYAEADAQFAVAAERFRQAEGPLSGSAIRCELRRQNAQLRRQTADSLAEAKSGFVAQQKLIAQLPSIGAELQAWQAMVQTGVMVYSSSTPEQTLEVLAPAVQRASATPGFSPALLSALRLRFCGIYLKLNRGRDAERVARETLATLAATQDTESPATFQPRIYLEEALLLEGKYGELIGRANRDYPLLSRILGPQNQLALSALDLRAQAEGLTEQYPAAIRDSLALHAAAAASPAASFMAGDSLNLAAELECRSGDLAAGLEHVRQLMQDASGTPTPQPYLLSNAALDRAECLLSRMEQAPAQAHAADLQATGQALDAINLSAVSEYSGEADFPARVHLARARLMLLEHKTDLARQQLAAAAPTLHQPAADPYERRQLDRLDAKLRAVAAG